MIEGIVAELGSAERFLAAARRLHALGYAHFEAFTPFPMPELDEILVRRRTRIPWLVLLAGLTGAILAYVVLWWTNAVDYPLDVGGRPYNSVPTHVPIMFETTVLFAGGAAFASAILGARLPRLHHPLFEIPGFERTTIDRFWIFFRGPVDDKLLAELARELAPFDPISVRAARGER
ncbi:MAG: DUF3341 domain-containing protein [Labilithrix sp.]|nr:DUF3341 domain-containing protein [Labilithrix sp.]